MPASQTAATERRNERMITHEPPKLKTTLKTPPKQATNPLQFVKVGPCSLYRTAQEQLQKVQEVKKIKQEVRDDPEDWQSNLDNWKSSRRKRQEHIIERVVEVKKLELEEHDRQRRRSKTFSEMMEERGNRGRKLSISLAMYHEEDANDLSDLGIGTSSGKSSVSGDTHDDTHSVLSDRDSEIEKNHSDVDNVQSESVIHSDITASSATTTATTTKKSFGNGFHTSHSHNNNQEYDSATTATTSSPEPEEYTYEGAIRGYVSRVSQNIPRRSLANLDSKLESAKSTNGSKLSLADEAKSTIPVVKVDILKRREIFEKASQKSNETKANNRLSGDFTGTKSIKERLSNLEKQKHEAESGEKAGSKALNRLSGDMSSIRERLSHLEKQALEREKSSAHRKLSAEELETVRPLRDRLSTLEKYSSSDESSAPGAAHESRHTNGELSARSIKDRLSALDAARNKETADKRSSVGKHSLCFRDQENRIDTSTPSERSSSPDSEYRVPRAAFHRSLDSLDADASSGPDTFERVQSLEELDYGRRYPASSSSAELLNDTDREDSGIHTADVSCSVSQADEPVDEDIVHANTIVERQEVIEEKAEEPREETASGEKVGEQEQSTAVSVNEISTTSASQPDAVTAKKGTADTSGELSTNKSQSQAHIEVTNSSTLRSCPATSRPIIYQSPKVPPRRSPPETLPKPKPPVPKEHIEAKVDSSSFVETNTATMSNIKLFADEQGSDLGGEEKVQSVSKQDSAPKITSSSSVSLDPAVADSSSLSPARVATVPTNLQLESTSNCTAKEVQKSTPVTSPRAASKIPTPLPRKTIGAKSSPTSSTSSLSPPTSPSSPKTPSLKSRTANAKSPTGQSSSSPQFPKASEIPIPVGSNVSSTNTSIPVVSSNLESQQSHPLNTSSKHISHPTFSTKHQVTVGEEALPAERRRTVVEICEKVVVPQGKIPTTPPVTPFITVDRVNEKQSSPTEEPIVIEKADDEEAAVICQPSQPVEHEEHEEKEAAMNVKIETYEPRIEEAIDVHDAPENVSAPERPTTLTFGKQEMANTVDTISLLSPVSPISKQILPLNLSSDEEIVTGLAFPLGPPTSVEPPKEKPPPPPVDVSDEENLPVEPLKRLNSTRRIKKELRTRRSDFLGIEGVNDDELERELTLTKPPDMAAILAEERRIEQLHRRSYDTDSNYEQDSSHERDSGVELGHAEDWTKQPVSPDMSQHSRQSSEPFGASVTSSEEDEITKKEKEIIEVLEKEEQWRYENNREMNSDLGEKLAHKLRELEEEKMQLERERAQEAALRRQEETLRKNEDNIRKQEETARQQEVARAEAEAKRAEEKRQEEELRAQAEKLRIQNEIEEERRVADARRIEEKRIRDMENQIREQEEVLRVKRELLQLQQEELKRQRNNLAYREQEQLKLAEQLQEQWKSLQDVAHSSANNIQQFKNQPPVNYRSSMPNLQLQDVQRRRPPPPPIPPAKPLRLIEQRQRDVTIRSSRIPSADSIPQQMDTPLRHSASVTTLSSHAGQQMSKQTLQALSAVPRPRIVQSDQWVQRRKSDVPRGAHDLNYHHHWLIQEAEQRRINEKNQRSPGRKPQMHITGTSVPYVTAPTRTDSKPLPDSIIQTLTQRVQNRAQEKPLPPRRRLEHSTSQEHLSALQHQSQQHVMQPQKPQQSPPMNNENQEKMLSVSGKKKCSHCGDELGRGAAMIIESLRLFYHMECFKCCVCHVRLGDGLMGTDVRVRNQKLHCHNCYSSDDGVKFSCV
ncbi:calponin homology domain-containing protein DDB_G0272472-like isoform X4 [Apis florea]|uniref:calponin homology domain-containing protein DDB_G0272472-like isoform X4 n=1 Tax=Apis florea TaxID=7463 RepID=UPI000629A76D|nr:calponin homology domain-containing protein DDB_G0272472-like isoform X4 [Apis florea]